MHFWISHWKKKVFHLNNKQTFLCRLYTLLRFHFFFVLRSLPLFSRGWHKGKAEVPWRLHSEASPPTEEKLWPICGLLSCQEEAPSREIGLFFFLSPDSRWQLCKAAQSWRQLVQVPILWDWESETSPPRKRGKQPRVEVWPCGHGQRVAINAKTSWTTKLGESPGMGSFGEQ